GAVERSGKEAAALSYFDRHGGWGHLNFGHVLGAEAPGKHERDPDHKRASRHNGANVNARKCRCQANLSPWYHTRTRRVVCLSSPLSPRCAIPLSPERLPLGWGLGRHATSRHLGARRRVAHTPQREQPEGPGALAQRRRRGRHEKLLARTRWVAGRLRSDSAAVCAARRRVA